MKTNTKLLWYNKNFLKSLKLLFYNKKKTINYVMIIPKNRYTCDMTNGAMFTFFFILIKKFNTTQLRPIPICSVDLLLFFKKHEHFQVSYRAFPVDI